MEKSKAFFGEAESIMEQTRTKPTGLVAKRIKSTKLNVKSNMNNVGKKNMSNNIKKPNSFSK